MYATLAPDYGRPANRPAFGGTVPLFYQMSRVPLNHVPLFVRSRIFLARAQFVTLPRCPEVNSNHPIERNYGNSVRFRAKIPNGTAAELPCYSVFWNEIDFCRLYTSKKISMWALPTVPLFSGKSRFFTRNVPLKTFSGLAGLLWCGTVLLRSSVASFTIFSGRFALGLTVHQVTLQDHRHEVLFRYFPVWKI